MGYNNLEKVKSIIFKPAFNINIVHNVKVASKNKEGKRQYAHQEFSYKSNNYIDVSIVSNVNVNFESYIEIIDISRDWTDDRSVRVGYIQLPILIKGLKKVTNWFDDEKYDTLYYIEDGDLKLNPEFNGLRETIQLGYNRGLIFAPTIIIDNDNVRYEGVEMIINNAKCIGKITVDNLEAMYYIFKNMNLYDMGLNMMSYIGRPEFDDDNSNYVYDKNNMDNERTYTIANDTRIDDKPEVIRDYFK